MSYFFLSFIVNSITDSHGPRPSCPSQVAQSDSFTSTATMSKSRSGSSKKESESPPLGYSPQATEANTEDTYSAFTPDTKAGRTPTSEESVTPPLVGDTKPVRKGPQLIGDLPCAEEEALRTFTEIPGNQYQYGTLGRSREALESMTCECQYEHGQ